MIGDDSVRIPRPRHLVFDVLVDGLQNHHWRHNVVKSTRIHGDGGAGTEWHMEVRTLGRDRPRDYVVEQCERPVVYAIRFLGGRSRGTATYTLSDEDSETLVALHLQSHSAGLFRAVGGAVPRELASDLADLQRLRAYLTRADQDAASSSS